MNPEDVRIGMMVKMSKEGHAWYDNLHPGHHSPERLGPGWRGRVTEIKTVDEHDRSTHQTGTHYVITEHDHGGVFVKFIEPDIVDLDDILTQLEKDLLDKDKIRQDEGMYYPYNSDME